MSRKVRVIAPGKINLCLLVGQRRPDGYHAISSLMQMIDVEDFLVIEEQEAGIALEQEGIQGPQGRENLVIQAAEFLMRRASVEKGVRIRLTKNIPIASGLGGGSSNAAAVIKGINALWSLGYSREEMVRIGGEIGSDIPFFFFGPTALVEGRGEEVFPLRLRGRGWFLLVNPGIAVSTGWAYDQFDRVMGGIQGLTKRAGRPTINKLVNLSRISFVNDLEKVTEERHPVISEIKRELLALGASGALMSGSGATVFGLFPSQKKAGEAAGEFSRRYPWWVRIARPRRDPVEPHYVEGGV